MTWTAEKHAERYEPTADSVERIEFGRRLGKCEPCRHRRLNSCLLAGQMLTLMARWDPPSCPLGLWECAEPLEAAACGHTVDVVVPTYNCADYLEACLQSLTSQTYWIRITVVDDGSSDASRAVIDRFPRVRYIRHKERLGAQAARQTGKDATNGEFVVFADADAIYHPRYIERLVDVALSNDATLTYSD